MKNIYDWIISLLVIFLAICLIPFVYIFEKIIMFIRWLARTGKSWMLIFPILLILLLIYIPHSAQIEAPFDTETYENIKAIILGFFMVVMAGIVVAMMMWRKK